MKFSDFERQTQKPYVPHDPIVPHTSTEFKLFLTVMAIILLIFICVAPVHADIGNKAAVFDELIDRNQKTDEQLNEVARNIEAVRKELDTMEDIRKDLSKPIDRNNEDIINSIEAE